MVNETYFDNFPELESERLIFRKIVRSDAADIRMIRTNDKVMKYMDSPEHLTIADTEKFIAKNFEIYKNRTGIFWAITDKTTNQLLGDFAYWKITKENSRGEIGYTLKPEYWRKGYMKETMITLLNFGFKDLNLHSIEANVNPGNENSKRILLKMGFRKEAYFREHYFFNGKYLDSEIYSLLEKDMK